MTDNEIEAEVVRVGALVREYMKDMDQHAESHEYEDVRVQTWMIGAVVRATDSDGDTREIVSAAYESSSRVTQTGMTVKLADTCRHLGEVYE